MLREKRRAINFKPNRRLDKKSTRGMLYENDGLRLRTINISADIDKGQSDIRKLRRENELLRREVWTLRDEYTKLDKMLQEHGNQSEESDDSESSDVSEDVCTEIENNDIETVENNENNQKSLENKNKDNDKFHVNFDMLSTVSEENLTNNSDRNSSINIESVPPPMKCFENLSYTQVLSPFQSDIRWVDNKLINETNLPQTPNSPGNFFAPIKPKFQLGNDQINNPGTSTSSYNSYPSTFQMGGNLEDLLSDIENLSQDIHELQIQNKRYHSEEKINYKPDILTTSVSLASVTQSNLIESRKPFRSEVSLVLSKPGHPSPLKEEPMTSIRDTILPIRESILPNREINLPTRESIGFETFTKDPKVKSKFPTNNSSSVRKQFLKGPSMSLNELVNSKSEKQHSKEIIQKTRSLDVTIPKSSSNNVLEKVPGKPPEKSQKQHKSHRVSLLFKKKKNDEHHHQTESIINNDKMDNYNHKESPQNTFKHNKHNSHKHKKATTDVTQTSTTKLRRGSDSNKFNKKYSRLSIDSATNFYESQDSQEQRTSFYSEKNSNSFDSSRESSVSYHDRRRKVSLTSHNNEKIPWCGCWGNGCF